MGGVACGAFYEWLGEMSVTHYGGGECHRNVKEAAILIMLREREEKVKRDPVVFVEIECWTRVRCHKGSSAGATSSSSLSRVVASGPRNGRGRLQDPSPPSLVNIEIEICDPETGLCALIWEPRGI